MATEQDQLRGLVSKRGQIKAKISRNKTFLDKCTDSQKVEELKRRLGKVEECWREFEDIQSQIELIDTDKDHDVEREEFEQQYYETCGEIDSFIKQHSSHSQNGASSHHASSGSNTHNSQSQDTPIPVRLPTINLPSFSGKYDEWMPFSDSFTALIDNNDSLNDIQKLHYLKAALLGDAANTIRNLELTASNYKVAVSLLKDQFQNTRLIVQQHVKSLFDLPHVQRENPTSLRQLINNTLTHMRALEALNVQMDIKDPFIIHLVTTKLDTSTHKEWELSTQPNELPTFKELIDFLQKRCQILENISHNRINFTQIPQKPAFKPYNNNKHFNHSFQQKTKTHVSVENTSCYVCDGNHPVYHCKELIQASHQDRLKKLSAAKLCLNCLRQGHRADQCKSSGCRQCGKKHNTALHYASSDPRLKALQSQHTSTFTKGAEDKTFTASASLNTQTQCGEVLLSTSLVDIISPSGIKITCRAFLDNGSQSNFMTEALCQRLQLKRESSPVLVTGISEGSTRVTSKVNATFKSRNSNYEARATFLVLSKITGLLPPQNINPSNWNIPQNLCLADPNFSEPSKIDVLLGQEYFLDILDDGRLKNDNMPVLQNTKLGWIFGGRVSNSQQSNSTSCHLNIMEKLDQTLQSFWRIEEPIHKTTLLTAENKICEELFTTSVQRNEDGRFTVKMPIKQDPLPLGRSKEAAIRRFHQVERRFKHNSELHQQYKTFMTEYEELGHMELIHTEDNSMTTYYLPHHPVFKQSSTTTKLRVVFDASAKTSTGTSLNDTLMTGPTLQDDLFSILLRFRLHPYVFTADIEKMYRQIWVDQSQRDMLRIVWREDSTKPLQTYKLKTVTYGTACAPYLAVKTLQTLAQDEEKRFPEAARVASRDFYVDDVLTGTDSIQQAVQLRDQLIELLKSGGFNLRKFASNSSQLLKGLPCDMMEGNSQKVLASTDTVIKTLGIYWDAESDVIKFTYIASKETHSKLVVTKRNVLSDIAKLFDPLGIISPIIIKAKIFMQELWQHKINWDESLPEELSSKWQQFKQGLMSLNHVTFPRCVVINKAQGTLELHGFSDASEKAYGGAVYLRHELDNGTTISTLLCSKSRVAPLKTVSLPRLELCGALLLTELMEHVKSAFTGHKITKTLYWTDSSIVLAWLAVDAACWKTFIANRVAKIQELSDYTDWRHVKGEENPADLVSRGMHVEELISSNLWKSGPSWLAQDRIDWPISPIACENDVPERKKQTISSLSVSNENTTMAYILTKSSTLQKLQRVTAYCLRFIQNCKGDETKITGPLTSEELHNSLKHFIKHEQNTHFSAELKSLSCSNQVHKKSRMVTLHPLIDQEGIIRVGGRLENSTIAEGQKHPVVLPDKSRLTHLIIEHEHIRNLHSGQQTLLSIIRQQYWPLNARNVVRQILHKCIRCFKARPRWTQPEMGTLPAHRINPSRPFVITGVDYCGPVYIRSGRTRKFTLIKSYIAVFVCFSTRAIHLELVSDLTTEAFLAAFKRFTSRRGVCQHVYSDNGTTFVGANNEIKELHNLHRSNEHQDKVINATSSHNIKWHFIPPRSPHFGGLWEAGVKSVKQHLRKVVGNASLTFEDLCTVLTMIEACLNSRPLTPLSCDPKDPLPLTPGHFLTGQALTSLPEQDFTTLPSNRLSQWQRLQQLMQHFWSRWSREYLSQLQQRQKWTTPVNNIEPGTVVIIKDDNLPPLKWITAIVEEVHPGVDGKVRVATVKTSTGHFKRAVNRLCMLPIEK